MKLADISDMTTGLSHRSYLDSDEFDVIVLTPEFRTIFAHGLFKCIR